MSTQPVAGGPNWLRDAARAFVTEVASFGRTALRFMFKPRAFAREWREGRTTAMNPIGFLATSAMIVGAVRQLAFLRIGRDAPNSLLAAIGDALGPYAHYALLALVCHVVLRPLAREGMRLRDSLAFALYAGGGPAALGETIAWIAVLVVSLFVDLGRAGWVLPVSMGLAFALFCGTLAASLGALHRAKVWQLCLAYVIAFPLIGLIFGLVDPPGRYGMHWQLEPFAVDGSFAPRLYLGL